MSDTLEQAKEAVKDAIYDFERALIADRHSTATHDAGRKLFDSLDIFAAAGHAEAQREAFALVEQEARRRAEYAKEMWGADSLLELANFCRQQREGAIIP